MSLLDNYAVDGVGKKLYLIKDNKIVGEGYAAASAEYIVSVEMRDERAKELVRDSTLVKGWEQTQFAEKAFKWALFHFAEASGRYVDEWHRPDCYHEPLKDVRVVDAFKFDYGWVPQDFKDVEGFGAAIKRMHDTASA